MLTTKVALAVRERCSLESRVCVCFRGCRPRCQQKAHEAVAGARLALQIQMLKTEVIGALVGDEAGKKSAGL